MGRGSPIVYHQMILLFEKCIEITTHFFCRRHSVEQFVSHALNIPRFHYRGNLYWGYISQEPRATFPRLLRNWKSLRIELPRVSYQTKYSFPCWLHISFWSLYNSLCGFNLDNSLVRTSVLLYKWFKFSEGAFPVPQTGLVLLGLFVLAIK